MTTTEEHQYVGDTPVLHTRIPEDRAVPGIEYGAHVSGPGWSGYYVRATCPEVAIARTTPASDELAGTDRDILIALDNELEAIHRERIDAIAGGLPIDQANEWQPGCETWAIYYSGGQRGQMTVWPNGRGAVAWGGNSEWGEWDGHVLTLDSGERVEASGQVLTDREPDICIVTGCDRPAVRDVQGQGASTHCAPHASASDAATQRYMGRRG